MQGRQAERNNGPEGGSDDIHRTGDADRNQRLMNCRRLGGDGVIGRHDAANVGLLDVPGLDADDVVIA
jgi:hypothetical protein